MNRNLSLIAFILGLAAVTVILPLELLNLALGGALGMGTAAAAGQRLGSGDTVVTTW